MMNVRSRRSGILRNSRRWLNQTLRHPVFLTGLIVAGLVLGVRQVGGLQSPELVLHDQMIRLRPAEQPDPRLLIVTITEEDIRAQKRWPISDAVIARLLERLQSDQPRVIGLDLYRDIAQPPGQLELLKQLQAKNVVVVELQESKDGSWIPAPKGVPPERIGFADIPLDQDAVVRRSLLYAKTKETQLYAFSLRLSLQYLASENYSFKASDTSFRIGNTVFPILTPDSGAYQGLDDRGYQIMLNYRSPQLARQVTLTQVLNGEVEPEWIRDKVILIGTTAASVKDSFLTPLNLSVDESPKMTGVLVHAQMLSQIFATVLDGRSLIWFWSQPLEILWICGWSLVGGLLAWRFRHPLAIGGAAAIALSSLVGVCVGLFTQAGWVPLVPAAIALVGSGVNIIAYRLLHDAFHDSLTGLPNRALFMRQLQWDMTRSHRKRPRQADGTLLGVLFVGLDSFKSINDSFGHRLGDELLVAITQRLKLCLHPADQLARVGGDEFAILLRDVREADDVTHLADRLQRQVTQPLTIEGQEVFTSASVGIVLDRPDSNCQPEDILRDAHTAMNRAKASGKARYEVFVSGMRTQVMARLQLESDLRRAIERQEFRLHYQPVITLSTGKIAGFEALIRWQHPQRGFVHPAEFIPVAEETDLIIPMGQWVVEEACRQLGVWQDQFVTDLPLIMSVNLSGRQFTQPDLVERIEQIVQEAGLDSRCLKLEITESVAMTDVDATIALLQRFKSLNLRLSIDDFGTGYSSLSYLHRFPTDTIKVDRSFVSRMGEGSEDEHIVQTIIMLGHNLGMDIVAEGVETAEQLFRLRSLRCEYAQGYFFSKPLASDVIERLLKTDPQW